MTKKPLKKVSKKLPKMFHGAEVVRGEGMDSNQLDEFVERSAMDQFDASADMWIVVENKALDDLEGTVEVKGFDNKEEAVRFAQARANGNVDQRVLHVTNQILVIGIWNEL